VRPKKPKKKEKKEKKSLSRLTEHKVQKFTTFVLLEQTGLFAGHGFSQTKFCNPRLFVLC
jgi:hypothetical protein